MKNQNQLSGQYGQIIKARVIQRCIIPVGNRVEVIDTGNNFFLIHRAQTLRGKMRVTTPMTLWLRREDFAVEGGAL